MGWDYALVYDMQASSSTCTGPDTRCRHLYYNIPPAVLLTISYHPLCTKIDIYKILFLILIAVVSTTPWDSYLIHRRIWSYPPNAIVGPTLFKIPAEEIFFFVIQTYNTSILYLFASKPTLHPIYLSTESLRHRGRNLRTWKWLGILLLTALILFGAGLVRRGAEGLYLGLIIVWAGPFILLLWSLSYQLLLSLPKSNTLLPILLPTFYLWAVDTIALRRGTWVIESGTKLGVQLWTGLDLEEAFFFIVTNTLIVFGLVAFDNALAILEAFPNIFSTVPPLPSPLLLVRALLVSTSRYDEDRILGLEEAFRRLWRKSRSFYLASGFFHGRLRLDLILLYSFCRVSDDLVDEASSGVEARHWISKLTEFLDICYATKTDKPKGRHDFVAQTFPTKAHSALLLLPTERLSPSPLYDLVKGFETDLAFSSEAPFPIQDEQTLQTYGSRVAGTVAELCLELAFYHSQERTTEQQRRKIIQSGGWMGIALQYVNISRDIAVDAKNGRVYFPTDWLDSADLRPEDVLQDPSSSRFEALRQRLLDKAMGIYSEAKSAIELLPPGSRAPMRVAVESYVEIGRVLQEGRKPANKTAIVVGAGVGGVATAARLANAGFDVTVFEKNNFTGGRCSLIHHEDYRFDQGPSLLLLPGLFKETFEDLGTSLEDEGVQLLKCEPNYNIWFDDGESFELSTDVARMKVEVEKWEGKDGFERYLGFLQEAHRHYEISVSQVLKKNFTSLLSMTRPAFLRHLFPLHPFESIYSRASKYFWTERLRRVFTFGSMYMGMSPFDAPGTYSLLQYTELAEGIWYPKGGFHTVVEALVKIGERLGVKYRLSTSVSSVDLDATGRNATGVTLENGERISADVVIINADLVYAYNHLLPSSSYSRSLQKRSASCSSISFYWAMDRQIPELTTHNIFLAEHYRESFDDIFKQQLIPSEPSFYLNVPSRIDPTAAPKGKDSIVVLVPVGHLLDEKQGIGRKGLDIQSKQDWDSMVANARRTVFKTVEARTGARDLQGALVKEIVNTPQSWKEVFNLDKGAILGLSHSFFNVLCFRPKTKHGSIERLHFVGASAHPGTGVPIVLTGAKLTSEQVLEGFGMEKPWGRVSFKGTGESKAIDRIQLSSRVLGGEAQAFLIGTPSMAYSLVDATKWKMVEHTSKRRGFGVGAVYSPWSIVHGPYRTESKAVPKKGPSVTSVWGGIDDAEARPDMAGCIIFGQQKQHPISRPAFGSDRKAATCHYPMKSEQAFRVDSFAPQAHTTSFDTPTS
ncbi:MAG: hypothetical protein LQ345_003131 [Seirophora villosa]|nr:MAG: hypothetical protein LQ345_003131 [Seirophora villosa]